MFPCSSRFDSVQQELNKSSAQNKELQREMERLQSEVTRYKNLQLKSAKDCEKYKEERDSVFNEYRLIMSERDQVIKELDKLQTELEAAEARLKNTSSERVVASEELEALRQVTGRGCTRLCLYNAQSKCTLITQTGYSKGYHDNCSCTSSQTT